MRRILFALCVWSVAASAAAAPITWSYSGTDGTLPITIGFTYDDSLVLTDELWFSTHSGEFRHALTAMYIMYGDQAWEVQPMQVATLLLLFNDNLNGADSLSIYSRPVLGGSVSVTFTDPAGQWLSNVTTLAGIVEPTSLLATFVFQEPDGVIHRGTLDTTPAQSLSVGIPEPATLWLMAPALLYWRRRHHAAFGCG